MLSRCLGFQDPLLLLSHPIPQWLLGQQHRRQGAKMGCLLLNQTLSAKVLQEGRKKRRGDSLEAVNRKSRDGSMNSKSLERCDSSSSPFPLWESQPMLSMPCPKFMPVLQPSQLGVKQKPQRTVSFTAGRDQDVLERHLLEAAAWHWDCWQQL